MSSQLANILRTVTILKTISVGVNCAKCIINSTWTNKIETFKELGYIISWNNGYSTPLNFLSSLGFDVSYNVYKEGWKEGLKNALPSSAYSLVAVIVPGEYYNLKLDLYKLATVLQLRDTFNNIRDLCYEIKDKYFVDLTINSELPFSDNVSIAGQSKTCTSVVEQEDM